MANYNDRVSDEGLREGWLANWLITERETGFGGSCIQLTQSDLSAHGLIVVKEITHTHRVKSHMLHIEPHAKKQKSAYHTWRDHDFVFLGAYAQKGEVVLRVNVAHTVARLGRQAVEQRCVLHRRRVVHRRAHRNACAAQTKLYTETLVMPTPQCLHRVHMPVLLKYFWSWAK